MRRTGKKLGKSLAILAMSAVLIGATVDIVCPVGGDVYASSAASTTEKGDKGTESSATDSDIVASKDSDILLTGVNAPAAKYGESTTVGFKAKVNGEGYITSISPIVSEAFPFETNDAAYMVVEGDSTTKELAVNYNFTVRSDVATGYQTVGFNIEYVKDGVAKSAIKTVNVKFEGAPATTEATTEAPTTEEVKISTPRVIVTGYETDVEQVLAGQNFKLTIHLQNTSKKTAVSNMKVSMAAANGEFLPTSGSSTQFIASLGAGKTTDIVLEMSALTSLEPKPYVLTVTCNYEDGDANPFESTENISIPVYQEARIKLTDMSVSPDTIAVNNQGSVSFSINNLGKSTLTNVQARLEGSTIECEDAFVGNIAAGATGYADITVTGVKTTSDDGTVKVIITYEDSAGKECTYEDTVTVFVSEEVFDDSFMDDSMMTDDTNTGLPVVAKILIAVGSLVVIAVIVVVIVIVVNKSKKKKAAEEAEELEDEIDAELIDNADKENVE